MVVGEVVIDAASILRFGRQVVIRRLKERRASNPGSQTGEAVASERVLRQRAGARHGVGRSLSVVVQIEYVLIEIDGCRSRGKTAFVFQVCNGCGLKRLAGKRDRGAHRNDHSQTFRVEKEEQLVLLDWSPNRSSPLVGVTEVLRI